jgi:hypothetical protein
MSNWIGDFHPALLLRALGLVVIFSALYVYRLLAHPPWSLGASLRQRILRGSPPWRHHRL